MTYGFNEDKSKAEVYKKSEMANLVKVVNVSKYLNDNGDGKDTMQFIGYVPAIEGYTAVCAMINTLSFDKRPFCTLSKTGSSSNIYINVFFKSGSGGTTERHSVTVSVFFVKNEFISTVS